MAKLTDALKEAASLGAADDQSFISECTSILTKLKRGFAEVKKAPALLDEVPSDIAAWPFFLRLCEKASFAKQAWEATVILLQNERWSETFAQEEQRSKLNLWKAGQRDVPLVLELLRKQPKEEVKDFFPLEQVAGMDPGLCTALTEFFQETDAEVEPALSAALLQRAATCPEVKRKVVAPESKSSVGKDADLPVFVCEGISGSHQKMEIKKGL
ncbi:unnamed protein product [Durusdinium trenchii]|uniref:Uncharacterized protein n=2 Tax=Durusdinium trenchii TaxID=1381693 RepID=A0ABP0J8G9_9DINO